MFPLGTNDSPSNAGGLAANLAAVRQLAGDRCVVVATLSRPPVGGVSVAGLNRAVEQFAEPSPPRRWRTGDGRRSIPSLLVRDRVHATGEGYSVRATLLAEAVQGCLVGGGGVGASGIPAPRDPNARPPEAPAEPALVLRLDPLAASRARRFRPIAGVQAGANGSDQGWPRAGAGRIGRLTAQHRWRSELDLGGGAGGQVLARASP